MAEGQRRRPGGIHQLIELVDEHRGAVEYDLRARLNATLADVGVGMSYAEAIRLLLLVARDPTSQLAASLNGWNHPWSHEAMVLADLFDLTHMAAGVKRPKPYPRPWPDKRETRQLKPAAGTSQQTVHEVLARAGHTMHPPV